MSRLPTSGLTLLFVILLLAGSVGGVERLLDLAVVVALAVTALQWPGLGRIAKVFTLVALVVAMVFAIVAPERLDHLRAALVQGAGFAALLAMLGMLRHPVRRSGLVARATAWLLAFPSRSRYAAINVGSHFLSLLFNIGMVALIGDMIRAGPDNAGSVDQEDRRRLILAGMRGTALMTAWSPMGLGFAIVVTSIPGLDPVDFLLLAFVSSMLLLGVSCAAEMRREGRPPGNEDVAAGDRPSARPMRVILIACGLLLLTTILLHEWLDVGFIICTVLVLPVFATLWLAIEREPLPRSFFADLRMMVAGIDQMKTEAAVFLSATVIGAAMSLLVREQAFWQALQASNIPAIVILLACLALVPLSAAAYVPHSIMVVLLAQLLGAGQIGVEHPMTLALSLTLGWALAISISPISAMSLITARLCGVSSHVVGLGWNRPFVLVLLLLSSVLLTALYLSGL